MWNYHQASGVLDHDGLIVGVGYSGAPGGKNNPSMQSVPDVGPIPHGEYFIGDPLDTVEHGPHVLPLTPDPANEMFCRSSFLMHGDSLDHPGAASKGCIIMARDVRDRVSNSADNRLTVTA